MDYYKCPDPIRSYKIKMKVIKVQLVKEELEKYWDGYTNGMRKGSMLGWEAGFNAAVVIIAKLHPEIDANILKSLKDLLDKTIPENKEPMHGWDQNVRNDEIS